VDAALELAKQAKAQPSRVQEAILALESLQGRNDPDVWWHLGSLYVVHDPAHPEKGVKAIDHAARLGQPAAAYWLALRYRGLATQGDDAATQAGRFGALERQYLEMAAMAGHVNAMGELAQTLETRDPVSAAFWARTAQEHQGRLFPVTQGPQLQPVAVSPTATAPDEQHAATTPTQSDRERELQAELKQVKRELHEAQRRLLTLETRLEASKGRDQTITATINHAQYQSYLTPDMTAADRLNRRGLDLFEGRNYPGAATLFEQASAQGSTAATANLGLMRLRGIGIKQEVSKAVRLLREAASAGNVVAAENLGLILANGFGVKRDYAEATRWLSTAAEAGSVVANNALLELSALKDR
jgi:TPR repeat protein